MKAKKIIGKVLVVFLLVSIGVAIGKEMATRNAPAAAEPVDVSGEKKVVVYYMHGLPCADCMVVEETTSRVVREEFADAVAAGTMEFVSLDYRKPENEALADKYNVGKPTVIAVRFEDGKEVHQERRTDVLEKAGNRDELSEYVREAIRLALEGHDQ